ncbi:hypothetical protein BAE44_0015210 [Dichanthelium oligosanthes]|uniref:F-box domain-containing protein n=1 Tax=Dichanthelium oligosanthes TaxID=888268 RepID=A0A1E5VF58_9POAL|nr:hypothetical protein BAE44_0015210 [Dichanthelium oligosanthes]
MEEGITAPAASAYLPDDVIVEILARLPARPLHRFKCVSRNWHRLVTDPAHCRRFAQTLSGGLFLCRDYGAGPPCFAGLHTPPPPGVDTALSFLPPSCGEIEPLDSCNGLLLRCSSDHQSPPTRTRTRFYVVCNAAIGDWVALAQPSLAPGEFAGGYKNTRHAALGFDPAVSPCFHVFQLVEHEGQCYDFVEAVDIYSSDTGRWVLRESRWSDRRNIFFARQVTYLNGVMHLTTVDNAVASVDIKGQSWKVTHAPHCVDGDDGCGRMSPPVTPRYELSSPVTVSLHIIN